MDTFREKDNLLLETYGFHERLVEMIIKDRILLVVCWKYINHRIRTAHTSASIVFKQLQTFQYQIDILLPKKYLCHFAVSISANTDMSSWANFIAYRVSNNICFVFNLY